MPVDAFLTQTIPSLINGVSQQPAQIRLQSQNAEQVNCLSDVADGLLRRPPTEHLAVLAGSLVGGVPADGFKLHTINRGNGQKFLVVIQRGDINVFDLSNGSEVTVNDGATGAPASYDYLDFTPSATQNAETVFEAVTVADYTFVLNKSITAALSATPDASRTNAHEFLIFVKTYPGTAGPSVLTLTLGTTSVSTNSTVPTNTKEVADSLCNLITGSLTPNDAAGTTAGGDFSDWKFTRVSDNVVHAYQFQGVNDTVSLTDRYGEASYTFVTTGPDGEDPQIARFSDLPAIGVDGFIVKVSGSNGTDQDEFYVAYDETKKVWVETVKPGLYNDFDLDTMPHGLVYDASTGQFTFQQLTWESRLVGDTVSAPAPSFVNNTISDILVHKNRLVLIADESSIASEAGSFFNFWPTTVTLVPDSDPIDVAGTSNRVTLWDYAVPYLGGITLFSTLGDAISELVGSRDEVLKPTNARIEERPVYSMSKVRPVVAADSIYFALDRGNSTSIWQYTKQDAEAWAADEITTHIPTYLPPGIFKIAVGPAKNIMFFLSNDADYDNRLYVYRFHYVGEDQVMASWSYWDFEAGAQILNADFIETSAYLLIARQDGIHLETIDFAKVDEDEGVPATPIGYRVHLDSLVARTGSYDAVSGKTTWTLPYDQATNGGTWKIVKGGDWGEDRGSYITVEDATTDLQIVADGDHSTYPVYIGREYESDLELSEISLKDNYQSRKGARIGGRLQLKKARALFNDTGTFDAVVGSRKDDDEYTYTYTSQFVGEAEVGNTGLADGTFDFDISGDARNARIHFRSSSFLPFKLTAVEWIGRFVQQAQQV